MDASFTYFHHFTKSIRRKTHDVEPMFLISIQETLIQLSLF